MSMILYHGEPNGPSLTVLAALFEKGLTAELVSIDLAAGARHGLSSAAQAEVAMSVEGEGPVLLVGGEGMTDSVFIACYLDDIGSGAALRPADPFARWEMMMWCRQIIERCAPAAAFLGCRAGKPVAPSAMLDAMGSADLRSRWEEIASEEFADDKITDSEAKITQTAERAEALLEAREWLMGDFSIADLETYAWLAGTVLFLPKAFEGKPRLAAWLDRVAARPSVARALSLARTKDPRTSWAPGPEINRWG